MPRLAEMKDVFRHLCRAKNCRVYGLLDDSVLLDRFLADREEIAFEELVSRHGPMVRAVCRRILGPTADADDAFQATFLVLIRKARSINRTDLLANWLCAVAYRTARQALRRRYRLGQRERLVENLPEHGRPDDPPLDWLHLFDAALQRLPSKYREPMVLCELQGLPRPEAARKLGVNEGTLSSRLGRARDLLRQRLGRQGFPLAVGTALAPAIVPEALTASTAATAITISSASVSAIVLMEGVLKAMIASKLKAVFGCGTVLVLGVVASMQFTGRDTLAGGPPGKEVAAEKEPPHTALPAAPAPRSSALAAEYQPFQGEWIAHYAEFDGNMQSLNVVGADEQWKFTGSVLATGGEIKEEGASTFRIDVKAKPWTIDFSLAHFDGSGTGALEKTEYVGIFRFESDGRLMLCYRPKIRDVIRPTRFGTAPKSGAILVCMKRVQKPGDFIGTVEYSVPLSTNQLPPKQLSETRPSSTRPVPSGPIAPPSIDVGPRPIPSDSVDPLVPSELPMQRIPPSPTAPSVGSPRSNASDLPPPRPSNLDLLQGEWKLTKRDGKPATELPDEEENGDFVILQDRILMSAGTHGWISVDENSSPKRLIMNVREGREHVIRTCIFHLDGDLLTIALHGKISKLIPVDFEPDDEVRVAVYERVKVESRLRGISSPRPINATHDARTSSVRPRERDLQKEVDKLREQLKRLENELNQRAPIGGPIPNPGGPFPVPGYPGGPPVPGYPGGAQ